MPLHVIEDDSMTAGAVAHRVIPSARVLDEILTVVASLDTDRLATRELRV